MDRSISLYNERILGVGTPRMDFYPQQNERLDIYTQNDMGRLEKRWVGKSTPGL